MTEFCGIPIHFRDDMPVGVMIAMSADGRQIIPIVNIDIEVDNSLHRRFDNSMETIMPGPQKITGSLEVYFEDKDLVTRFLTNAANMAQHTMAAMVRLGDQLARDGSLNRSGREKWRKDRKRLAAFLRREDARERRRAYGLATF